MLDVVRIELHNIIVNEEEFEVRQPILNRYREILQTIVEQDSHNMEAYYLLAMVIHELRIDGSVSLSYLTKGYEKSQGTLSENEYAIWATNMAYFCLEEGSDQKLLQAKYLLQKAATPAILYPQTFYAYGRTLFELGEFITASKQFHKCYVLTKEKKYRYNEAVSLIKGGNPEQAVLILKDIMCYPFKSELDAKIHCVLGNELARAGEKEEATVLAKQLEKSSSKEFAIDEMDLANLMYLIEDYEAAKELYEQCNHYLINEEWISRYFYVLYRLGLKAVAAKKMKAIKKGIRNSLLDVKHHKSLFEEISEREKYIEIEKQRLKKIKEGYCKVFDKEEKPSLKEHYDIQYFCFYIGCPRHM